MPALAVAAAVTTRLRIGALVWANDYKHPVVLAKELATLDVLSDGRLEVGLGAGWMRTDYEQAGMAYDSPGVRISRLEEALDVIERRVRARIRSTSTASTTGSPATTGSPSRCRPGRQLLLGGGAKRMLSLAARRADIVGVNGSLHEGAIGMGAIQSMSAEAVDEKLGWVRAAAGDRFDDARAERPGVHGQRHRRPPGRRREHRRHARHRARRGSWSRRSR